MHDTNVNILRSIKEETTVLDRKDKKKKLDNHGVGPSHAHYTAVPLVPSGQPHGVVAGCPQNIRAFRSTLVLLNKVVYPFLNTQRQKCKSTASRPKPPGKREEESETQTTARPLPSLYN